MTRMSTNRLLSLLCRYLPLNDLLNLTLACKRYEDILTDCDQFMDKLQYVLKLPKVFESENVNCDAFRSKVVLLSNSMRLYKNMAITSYDESFNTDDNRLTTKDQNFLLRVIKEKGRVLEQLSLESCNLVSKSYVSLLSRLPSVKVMNIFNCNVVRDRKRPKKSVPHLLPGLEELHLYSSSCLLIDQVFCGVKTLKTLEVEIDENWVKLSLVQLENFIKQQGMGLKSLKISSNIKALFHRINIINFESRLDHLSLNFVELSPGIENFVYTQRDLKRVELTVNVFTEGKVYRNFICGILSNNKNLQSLKFVKHVFRIDGESIMDGVVPNVNVESFSYHEVEEYQPALFTSLIKVMPNLKSLDIIGTGQFETDAEYCETLSSLKFLETLKMYNFDSEALYELRVESLKDVDIEVVYSDTILQDVIVFLSRHQQIKKLKLELMETEIDTQLCNLIMQLLPQLEELRATNFEDLKDCADVLMKSDNLKSLEIPHSLFLELHESTKKFFLKSKLNFKFLKEIKLSPYS
jgi:hypothetical protein